MATVDKKIVVAVMGATGTGKSTFVNLITGNEDATVSHGLFSGTSSVTSYPLTYKSRNFLIVDTPGFDDSRLSDREILRILVTWLETSFRAGEKLAGIIYFHRITDPRMQGSALSNLETFKKLCGQDYFKNIILGTSFWGVVDNALGKEREAELTKNVGFWGGMIRRGSRIVRIPETQREARDLIFQFAANSPSVLESQRETVIEGKSFQQTAASQELQREKELQKQKENNERQRQEQERRHQAELRALEVKAFEQAEAARKEQQRKLETQEKDRKRLEIQKAAEEARRKAAEAAAKAERERLEREAANLAERMEKLKIQRSNAARKKKRDQSVAEIETLLQILAAAKNADKIMVNFREPSTVYGTICDNCFRTTGLGATYRCLTCCDGDFCLCEACHAAVGVYCDDKAHFSSMVKIEAVIDANQNCKRVKSPVPVGIDLLCSRCFEACGAVYLHCCLCDNDNFDMCVNCALKYRTCKKPWSLSGHPLDICARYIGKAC